MRQPVLFVLVGLLQLAVDTALFALLISLSVPTAGANVLSRVSAALLGFALNRYGTFQQSNDTLRRLTASLSRFILLFLALTVISTTAIVVLESLAGGGVDRKVLYKLVVEGVLAVISFLVSKYWVYRN